MKKLKCDNCGADIEVDESKDYGVCPYCKTKYQLNETKNIKISMDDNTKSVMDERMKVAKSFSKMAMIPFIIGVVVFILIAVIGFNAVRTTEKKSEEKHDKVVDNMNKSSFNSKFELFSGTEPLMIVKLVIDDVVTNNKKEDRKIKVTYGEISTEDIEGIKEIKNSLEDKQYEIEYNYDKDGYINELVIEVSK